jgi:hypothetical protein
MSKNLLPALLSLLLFCAYNAAYADEAALALHPQWLALLEMRRGFDGVYRSEVDTKDFFLSQRRDDPQAELQATIAAMQQKITGPHSAWCRFPARAYFITTRFGVQPPSAAAECHELENWRGQFHADELVLVYPEPYLKNVASIFGHTFLRLDAADKKQHPVLLSKGLSYYADVASEGSAAAYIAKGLGGGFKGVIEVAPYFQKLRKYSDNEDRDIWEYRLALSPAQIRLFLDHVWEVRGHSFNYFFLDENCSYRLITMLDVVTPTHRVREAFSWHAIPVDTVRALYDAQLIAHANYVPSARKVFYQQVSQLNAQQREALLALTQGRVHQTDRDDLSVPDLQVPDLQVLSLAMDYSGMQMRTDPAKRATHTLAVTKLIHRQAESHALQSSASKQSPATQPSTLQGIDPVKNGHRQTRLQAGIQHRNGADFLLLGARAAYHDFHDAQKAYQSGVQLEVLDMQWLAAWDASGNNTGEESRDSEDGIRLDSLRWFSLRSYNKQDDFFQEPSWGINVARERQLLGDSYRLLHVADGYRGVATSCGVWLCHAEGLVGVLSGSALDDGWTARLGARAGMLYQTQTWSGSVDISQQKYLLGEHDTVTAVSLAVGYPLARNLSLHAAYTSERNAEGGNDRLTFALRSYF